VPAAVVQMHGRVHGPAPDQPAIELHLVGAVGGRAIARKGADEGTRDHRLLRFGRLQVRAYDLDAGEPPALGKNC
jgi:hypothetical protein